MNETRLVNIAHLTGKIFDNFNSIKWMPLQGCDSKRTQVGMYTSVSEVGNASCSCFLMVHNRIIAGVDIFKDRAYFFCRNLKTQTERNNLMKFAEKMTSIKYKDFLEVAKTDKRVCFTDDMLEVILMKCLWFDNYPFCEIGFRNLIDEDYE